MDYKGRNVRFGAIVDITDRKQAEEELQEITERLHLATASAKAGVWDWNLQTNGMIWDDRMLELYGLTHENFPGGVEAWEQGLHPDDSSRAVEECQAALRGERDFDTEFRVRHPDGTVVHIKADGLVLRDEKGKPLRMIGLNTDITKSKQEQEEKANLEAQIQQSHKMESVGRLAGGVAHDFNNKLGVILGYTEMALDQVEPTLPLHADLEQIRTAANHAADLTRQLLAFARKQTVAPKVLDLNKTVTSMLKMLQRLIGENIHINWQPDANLWPVKVDPSQIDQILTNLCINARDAISDVGKMTIETGKCSFDEDYCAAYTGFLPGEYVLLAVSDNGCGMDKETLSHLFEPFYTTKVVSKGTGLGLATVYGIVSQNNGIIKVYSEPDKGTTFRIYLPRHEGKTKQVQTRGPVEACSRGRETILLVEDDPSILEMTTRMLKKQGYTVLSANSPGEAIHLARERTGEIHLLMTDVVMPEMNGRDLAKNLLSLFPHLKRLFMSGYTANVIAHHGVLDEGVYFIQKPFSIKELAAKVREALDQE
ncbi:MAG: PAS domain-containing protein, partial [Syntrophus sp. (in: bacteria)]